MLVKVQPEPVTVNWAFPMTGVLTNVMSYRLLELANATESMQDVGPCNSLAFPLTPAFS